MSDNAKKAKAICVIGMHRSGTSAMARTINMLGAYIGARDDMMLTNKYNPEGYWEQREIVGLHDRTLRYVTRGWNSAIPIPDEWFLSKEAALFKEELAGLIQKKFSSHNLWVWKDPRTSLLFPTWKDVLKEMQIEVSCVFMVRNPLDVARSLEKRDGLDMDKSFLVWLKYNLAALKSTADVPRIIISYDIFLNDCVGELKRCALALGIPWPEDDSAIREEIKGFIQPDMRHSFSELKELKKAGAPRPVIELYELLMGAIDSQAEPDEAFNRKVEKLSKGFSLYTRPFQENMIAFGEMTQKIAEQERRLAERCQQIANRDQQITKKNQQLANKDQTITKLGQQIAERDQQIENKNHLLAVRVQKIAEMSKKIAELNQRMADKNHTIADKDIQIQTILNSLSWKVTAPMRKTLSLISGKQG